MTKKMFTGLCLGLLLMPLSAASGATVTATFEDNTLAPESFWNGSDGSGGFTSGNMWFENSYTSTDWGGYWSGFSYSSMTDTSTSEYINQYSAITGSGVHGSGNYAVAYVYGTATISGINSYVDSAWFTNTTYAALSMEGSDDFAKKFGGDDGNDPDWFKLTITGRNSDVVTGSVDFFLADFRSDNSYVDYILKTWNLVDLSSLGYVTDIDFSLSSSDNGDWGMNTPGYFAVDNITVHHTPIPGAVWLLGSGLAGLFGLRKKKRLSAC